MLFEMLVIWMMVSPSVELARTFGKARIDAPLCVVTVAFAGLAIIPSATATPQSPERKAYRFSVRIALLLSRRPRLIPHSLALETSTSPRFSRTRLQKWRVTYSKFKRIVKGISDVAARAAQRVEARGVFAPLRKNPHLSLNN
jgi:hypothetical protein